MLIKKIKNERAVEKARVSKGLSRDVDDNRWGMMWWYKEGVSNDCRQSGCRAWEGHGAMHETSHVVPRGATCYPRTWIMLFAHVIHPHQTTTSPLNPVFLRIKIKDVNGMDLARFEIPLTKKVGLIIRSSSLNIFWIHLVPYP